MFGKQVEQIASIRQQKVGLLKKGEQRGGIVMIIVMKQNAPLEEIERLETELTEKGFQVDRSKGASKVVLGLVGDTSALDERDYLSNGWIKSCESRSPTSGLAGPSIPKIQ